jgi:3',5'-cyclic AMP phosphodiesterase CpdA
VVTDPGLPTLLVHLSDLHIRSDTDKESGHTGALGQAGLKAMSLVAHVEREHAGAHVVITGDVTDSGTATSYVVARNILKRWLDPARLSVVPGNHDCGTWGQTFMADRRSHFRSTFAPTLTGAMSFPFLKMVGHAAILGLDSNVKAAGEPLQRGHLGAAQVARLDALLAHVPANRVPVILLHHHPYDHEPTGELEDAAALHDCLARRLGKRPSLVLFGHRHFATSRTRSWPHHYQAPSSVIVEKGRLRYRLLAISPAGIRDDWVTCPLPTA